MAIATAITGIINESIKTICNFSIGGIFIWALKHKFKTENRKEKMFGTFGPVSNYEYMFF